MDSIRLFNIVQTKTVVESIGMSKKLIISNRVKKTVDHKQPGSVVISFDTLRTWVRTGRFFYHLLRYSEVVLHVYKLELIGKPFTTLVALKILSYNKTRIVDSKGVALTVTWAVLVRYFVELIKDGLLVSDLLSGIDAEISEYSELIGSNKEKKVCSLAESPTYLRTDLWFDVSSGGSVGHIAGVLNHLDCFSAKPRFLSSDFIPTVRPDIELTILGGKISYWDYRELPSLASNQAFYEAMLKTLENKNTSFVYQRYSLNNFCGVKLAHALNVPFILEYNGSEIWINRHWGTALKYEKKSERIELLNFQAADLIVVVSQPMKDELVERSIDAEKILVNPNGVNPEVYAPTIAGEPVREQLKVSKKQVVIGFIGTFGLWHGAEVLAEAFALLLQQFPEERKRLKLLLIGDGQTLPQVKTILAAYQLEENSILTGLIDQGLGPSYLAACDILVSPHVPNSDGTAFFGSPTKLFEYMAMGKCIIASDLDQIGEILTHDYDAWLVKPGDVHSLMTSLKILVDKPDACNRLGKQARKEVLKKYTWKSHTQRIIEKLKERCICE